MMWRVADWGSRRGTESAVRGLRLIGRGFLDSLEHLLPFVVSTLFWWLCVVLVLPAAPATVALVAITDPRRAVDRPEWREAVARARANIGRGWRVALLTVPPVVVLFANLAFYGDRASAWGVLVPLWTLLLLIAVAVCLYAFAVAGLTEGTATTTVKRALWLVLTRPFRALAVALVALVLVGLGRALVVPLVMFVPALVAAIVNRVVLDGLGVEVVDPLTPTPERADEERRRTAASRFGP